MKKILLIIAVAFCLYNCISCNNLTDKNSILNNPQDVIKGEAIFNQYCSGCHNFKQNGIGPQLSGITKEEPASWIFSFIKNPQSLIQSGDKHAAALYNQYKTTMPSFTVLKDSDINNIIAFLNTHHEQKLKEQDDKAIKDPIPEKIKTSNLVAVIKPIIQMPATSDINKTPLARITKLDYQPASKKLFVVDLDGRLYELTGNKASVYMNIAKLEPNFINEPGLATGFGSFAFHPEFLKNGLFYTTHTEKPNSGKADFSYADSIKTTLQWVLTEWIADDPEADVFKGTGRELLRINMVAGIHGVQEICFNPTAKKSDEDYGLLYIGIGDGGAAENGYSFLIHNLQKPWGTILRINPSGRNSANGKYGIPQQNPFIKNKNALGEIYAYGFRNPHRICWSNSGQVIVCNIGHSQIESIDFVNKGNDYGWCIREGTFELHPDADLTKAYLLPSDDSAFHITYPVAQYDHDEGKAISGGFEYSGNTIPQLKGKFLFGDIPTGRLLYVDMKDLQQGRQAVIKEWNVSLNGSIKKLQQICGSDRVDLHFGKDAAGELYILTKADGKIYKIVSAEE